mmetsp:Transcript_19585/g.44242  ORF Transcript_19585/g.44242 Transcript_19585/m.44242 type:complete len:404 (+) Transcript_19585:185-1396(+)
MYIVGMKPINSSVAAALILLLSPPICASSTAHQSKEGSVYSNLPPIVFAPSGRLHGVEKAARNALVLDGSVDDAACAVFSMKCSAGGTGAGDFAIMAGIRPSSPYLCREPLEGGDAVGGRTKSNGVHCRSLTIECDASADLASPITAISSSMVVGVGGLAVDSTVLLRRTTDEAMSLYHADNKGIDWFISHSLEGMIQDEVGSRRIGAGVAGVDVTTLSRRIADAAQASTQRMGSKFGRMLASSLLAVGAVGTPSSVLSDDKLVLWRVDPTGNLVQLEAGAVGRGAFHIESQLLRRVELWKREKRRLAIESECQTGDDPIEEGGEAPVVSNEDVHEFLSSLSEDDAIDAAHQCLIEGIMASRNVGHEDARVTEQVEIRLKRRVHSVVLRSDADGRQYTVERIK